MLGLGADGAPPLVQPRTVPSAMTGIPHLPASLQGYSYLIWKLGPLQFTRKGLSVASTAACLTFTVLQLLLLLPWEITWLLFDNSNKIKQNSVIKSKDSSFIWIMSPSFLILQIFQSASLCLTTTAPEQLAFALRWYLRPLMCIGVPVSEIILTLLLSLRFINLVFDEVRTQ